MRWSRAALVALALFGCSAAGAPGDVAIEAPGVSLRATYTQPAQVLRPAVVALHGCGGPFPARDGQWRDVFLAEGRAVLLPDSFGSRGLGSQCGVRHRGIAPDRQRRTDTVAAAEWVASRPETPAGGVAVVGWSNGGSTVLATAREGAMRPGLVRGFVAFYPGCRIYAEQADWAPSAPLLIVMGADDDWTPAAPCRTLAARFPDRIRLVLYPGAYHDFDAPGRPVRVRAGLAFASGGQAHVGTNDAARETALREVPAWIDTLPAAGALR